MLSEICIIKPSGPSPPGRLFVTLFKQAVEWPGNEKWAYVSEKQILSALVGRKGPIYKELFNLGL
jgi:hypothetical protein